MKYLSLPGGVNVKIKPQSASAGMITYSLSNMHGDTMATVNADGMLTGTFITGPFGEKLQNTTPANATDDTAYGYVGNYRKITETSLSTSLMQMGARVYIPELGRFLQVDPVEGGTLNNYVYAMDPVNQADISGEASRGSIAIDIAKYLWKKLIVPAAKATYRGFVVDGTMKPLH